MSLRKQRFSLACDRKIVWKISSAYMRLLIFLLSILIPACASFKINVDSDCSHEFKRCLVLGRKAMTNLNSILQTREITSLTKLYIVEVMVSPVVMCRCESWTIKRAECQRIDAYKLWCWRRLLRVPWTACKEIKSVNPKGNQP